MGVSHFTEGKVSQSLSFQLSTDYMITLIKNLLKKIAKQLTIS